MVSASSTADQIFMVDGVPLKVKLAQAERMRKIKAFGLILPLLVFLLITFVYPILEMLFRSIQNPEMAAIYPKFSIEMQEWDKQMPPPNELLRTFVDETLKAEENRTIGKVAKRLNYNISGFRTVIKKTGNGLERQVEEEGREAVMNDPNLFDRLTKIEKKWKDPTYWVVMQQAAPPVTSWYLLQAVDLDYDIEGEIVNMPEEVSIHRPILYRTVWISFIVTVLCLALGFPIAYLLATLPTRNSNLLILLLLLPFWTSLLVRTTAWLVLLQNEGVVNDAAIFLGIWNEPLTLVRNRLGTYIAMVHILLPFMTLPLFSVMKTIDPYHTKAALSLGANPVRAFLRVYLPQCIPGIGAGVLLVFILSLGYYITPALVGGPADQMLSYFIAFQANNLVNWGLASALAVLLMLVVLVFFGFYQKLVGVGNIRMG